MFLELEVSAVAWATFTIIVSQLICILIMWGLGLPPRKLVKEIEDVQNTAVGVVFFTISLTAAIFVSVLSSDGPTYSPPLETLAWIVGGVVVGIIYVAILFMITHRIMGRQPGENVYTYIRREVIKEQNAALALFLGGLGATPFIAIVYQIM
ncbi:MAG: hypothetical protein IAE83_12875 [Anaerolinea sp.]|nr:hypothetical protein [Anaerolinea sp.]MCC6976292.1 hypothetical protein [Anaerolineae bacterium]CAG1014385.1 hypothetical protein ANRL4_05201 [Anaerolineae bacterium]